MLDAKLYIECALFVDFCLPLHEPKLFAMHIGTPTLRSLILLHLFICVASHAQNTLSQRIDSLLEQGYLRANIDTDYVVRPQEKWTLTGRLNISGAQIGIEGVENGQPFVSEMTAAHKVTLSIGLSYLGYSFSVALNPAKLLGHYRDYELNFQSYGKRFGFDIAYQDAHNFTGWHEVKGQERTILPADMLALKTLNLNTYYIFNHRRFSYPAAFASSYIQHRSAGSFMLAASGQGQQGMTSGSQKSRFSMMNIGIGAGYGYNYVPAQGWLLHLSALPTFIVYSATSFTYDDISVPLHYHFPEVIITSRGAIVYQMGKTFAGLSMVFNFTNIGNEEKLMVKNLKWRARLFYGVRL